MSVPAREQQANNENRAKTSSRKNKFQTEATLKLTKLLPPFTGRENALLHTSISLKADQSSVGLTSDRQANQRISQHTKRNLLFVFLFPLKKKSIPHGK